MKCYGLSLLYLFTWRTVITRALLIGLLQPAVALYAVVFNSYLAFSLAVVAFVHLLGGPYPAAAPAMRRLILHRNLNIMRSFAHRWPPRAADLVRTACCRFNGHIPKPRTESFVCAGNGHGVALCVVQNTEQIRFNRVDWQVLKPVLNKRTQAEN